MPHVYLVFQYAKYMYSARGRLLLLLLLFEAPSTRYVSAGHTVLRHAVKPIFVITVADVTGEEE